MATSSVDSPAVMVLDAAIDPDPVIEVDDVVALGQRAGRGRRGRLPVPARPPEPPGAAEDLVVGEHPQRGHDEAAVERADRQRGPHRAAGALLQQLLETLELAFVVAQDECRRRSRRGARGGG